ncbi:hypothetical protein [Natronolimnobius sp. AArcel1]|uniref:hypothetical protein n=1 Tax=Natronolimnobius sp. AArcel1 TaxID=1679093 RepID=UPI001F14E414|nr:hypothetical protein [Natronolimnobius sp. AArcel1]
MAVQREVDLLGSIHRIYVLEDADRTDNSETGLRLIVEGVVDNIGIPIFGGHLSPESYYLPAVLESTPQMIW